MVQDGTGIQDMAAHTPILWVVTIITKVIQVEPEWYRYLGVKKMLNTYKIRNIKWQM